MSGYTFTVHAEVERTQGKFASRDAIEDELAQALESADPSNISPDDSEYDVIDWTVEVGAPEDNSKKAKDKDREMLETAYEMLGSAPSLDEDRFLSRLRKAIGQHLGKEAS